MKEHAVIVLLYGKYHVEWFDTRGEALAYRSDAINNGPRKDGVWYVTCPVAIITEVQS